MEDTTAVFGAWPGDADVAVALTFDVDGEAAWLAEGPEYGRRLTLLSQARFGPGRGLGHILHLLAELEIPGTFCVPGHTADHHPEAVAAASDHRDAQQRAPVVRHPCPDRRPGEPAGRPHRLVRRSCRGRFRR